MARLAVAATQGTLKPCDQCWCNMGTYTDARMSGGTDAHLMHNMQSLVSDPADFPVMSGCGCLGQISTEFLFVQDAVPHTDRAVGTKCPTNLEDSLMINSEHILVHNAGDYGLNAWQACFAECCSLHRQSCWQLVRNSLEDLQ
jgi:hypothetical protein